MTPALVVSGGGAKGAFEVGALEFLTRNGDFFPKVMAGTSAGSLICVPLAQASDAGEFKQLVQVVRNNCLSITNMSSLFGRQPWLDEIADTPLGEFIDGMISTRTRPIIAADPKGKVDPLDHDNPPRKHRTLFAIGSTIGKSGQLVKAGKYLHDLPSAIMNLDPLEAGYRGQYHGGVAQLDEDAVANSGITLRITVASLSDGVGRYVTEAGLLVEADATTPYEPGGSPGVIAGMCASASVPIVFPPRRLGDSIYVDGGVVQNTPVSAAVECGAKDVIVLMASPGSLKREETDFTKSSFMSIYARAAQDMTAEELERINLSYPLAAGATMTVIEPTVDVLGLFEVEGALLKMDMDYGWMRAAETMGSLPVDKAQELGKLSDTVVEQRERIWFIEERLLDEGADSDVVGALRRSRAQVLESVAVWQASGLPQPATMDHWGHDWEEHDRDVPVELQGLAVI